MFRVPGECRGGRASQFFETGFARYGHIERKHAERLIAAPPCAAPAHHRDGVHALEFAQLHREESAAFVRKLSLEPRDVGYRRQKAALKNVNRVGVSGRGRIVASGAGMEWGG